MVPFSAIKVFFDPSVRFGLQFEDPNAAPDARTPPSQAFDNMTARNGGTQRPSGSSRKVPRAPRKPRAAQEGRWHCSRLRRDGREDPASTSSRRRFPRPSRLRLW